MKQSTRIGLVATLGGVLLLGVGILSAPLMSKLWHLLSNSVQLKPSYPAASIAGALKTMCARDYHMPVDVRHKDGSLQIFFWRTGILKGAQLDSMRPEAADSLEHVLLCATRIALSTDAKLQFIEVTMADIITGATVTLWRFVPDIKDSMYTRMAEEEYINRLVIEVDTEGPSLFQGKVPHFAKPLTFAEFLGKQVVLRAKRQSTTGFQAHEDLSQPSTLVVVIDNWPALEQEGVAESSRVADMVEKTANTVIHGYRFEGFRGVVLQDPRGAALRSWSL